MMYMTEVRIPFVCNRMCAQRNFCVKVTKEERAHPVMSWKKRGKKTASFYLPFMRHSHYLNVCHISRDLLNSIYYNVMFGLNGKSMARQARQRCDHTKAISKLTYGGPV